MRDKLRYKDIQFRSATVDNCDHKDALKYDWTSCKLRSTQNGEDKTHNHIVYRLVVTYPSQYISANKIKYQ